MSQPIRPRASRWQQIMWSGAGIGLLLTIAVLLSFAANTVSQVMTVISQRSDADLGFVLASIGVVTQTLLRLLAILVGAAVAFAGLAVSFFAHEYASTASVQIGDKPEGLAKFTLATFAPGVVGVIVGAVVIVAALYARGMHEYSGPQTYSVILPKTEAAQSSLHPRASSPSGLRPLNQVLPSSASAPSK